MMNKEQFKRLTSLILLGKENPKGRIKSVLSWELVFITIDFLLIMITAIVGKNLTDQYKKQICFYFIMIFYLLDFCYLLFLIIRSIVNYIKLKPNFVNTLYSALETDEKIKNDVFEICNEIENSNSGEISKYHNLLKERIALIKKRMPLMFEGKEVGGILLIITIVMNSIKGFDEVVKSDSILRIIAYSLSIAVPAAYCLMQHYIYKLEKIIFYLDLWEKEIKS